MLVVLLVQDADMDLKSQHEQVYGASRVCSAFWYSSTLVPSTTRDRNVDYSKYEADNKLVHICLRALCVTCAPNASIVSSWAHCRHIGAGVFWVGLDYSSMEARLAS